MTTIKKLVLHNFKRFPSLEINFGDRRNTLIGDNESGKSTILVAIDLTLSASRSKFESIGLETLLSTKAVEDFLSMDKHDPNGSGSLDGHGRHGHLGWRDFHF